MPHVLKNPALPDYFLPIEGVSRATPLGDIPSVVPQYEAGKVLTFPDLKLDIDHDFWAGLPIDAFPAVKKMTTKIAANNQQQHIENSLEARDVPIDLRADIIRNIGSIIEQVMPIYFRLFGEYSFSIQRAIWRLNTTRSENMHFDTYKEGLPEHFARMFINLDNQPRIWNTSYPTETIFEQFRSRLPDDKIDVDTNRFWRNLQMAMFGPGHSFDNEPRHTIFFDPGDVWIVDSRQVAHQIFYGRRAVSIDFVVTLDSMLDKSKHYLEMSKRFKAAVEAERVSA